MPAALTHLNVWLPKPCMLRYVRGVPRSENRMVTWCVDSGVYEKKSQNALWSFSPDCALRLCVCTMSGNLNGSRMKNTGVLLPTMS